MNKTPAPQVHLRLPDGPDRDALRAGLLALHAIPVNLPASDEALADECERLVRDPRALVFLDLSNALPQVTHRFDQLLGTWPSALRARTVLTRLAAGHVSPPDQAWVQSLGFADLVGSFEDHSPGGALQKALALVAQTAGLPALAADDLARYLRAVPGSPARPTPRARIRTATGQSAEALTDLLQARLDIRERSYRLRPYPACFVGTEAVRWMSGHFRLDRPAVLGLGQALQELGLLYHVAHERAFADEVYFFRLRAPCLLPQVALGQAWQTLRERLPVRDRNHLGQSYPRCWIGQEAVDLLCAQGGLTRPESQLVLHRLMQFGLFEHVVGEHGLVDGHYFYRFNDRPI